MGSDVQRPTQLSGEGAHETLPESGTGASPFRPLADALPYLVWVCHADGTLDYLNRQGMEYFGHCADPGGADGSDANGRDGPLGPDGPCEPGGANQSDGADRANVSSFLRHASGPDEANTSDTTKRQHGPCGLDSGRPDGSAAPRGAFLYAAAIYPQDLDRATAAWCDAMRHEEPLSVEVRLRRADGVFRWHLNRAQPLRDATGNVVRWIGTSTDVHEVREASERSTFLLSLSAELAPMGNPQELVCAAMLRLREQLGAALVTLVELDEPRSEAVMLRQRRGEGSQIEVASLPLRPFLELASGARQGRLTVIWDLLQDKGTPYLYDRWFGLDGVRAVVSAPLLQAGSLVALLSVVESEPRNWTEAEVELVQRVAGIVWPAFEKARADRAVEEALRDMNRRKDEFLAMLGHELRNPLAPISSAVQILKMHASSEPRLEWAASVVERQTRHLARLVDDLLDVSRIVRGQIVLQRTEIDVADVMRHGIETSGPLIEARGHRLHVQMPPEPLPVLGDLTRLAQVLSNLLNNAAKYTDEGGDIWLEGGRQGAQAEIRIRDSGAGIPSSLLPRVFELFTQAERTLDRSQGGLGIGLTLVKLLVEMHGGSVEANSAGTGLGAEFVVRLPAPMGAGERVAG